MYKRQASHDLTSHLGGPSAAIINETMAAHLFPGQDPIGRTIHQDKATYTIVGVARDSKFRTIGEKPSDAAYLFLNAAPEKATSFFGTTILVKTSMDPRVLESSVRQQIAALDPNMAVFNAETMQEPVSYTHLDVYKRQVRAPNRMGNGGDRRNATRSVCAASKRARRRIASIALKRAVEISQGRGLSGMPV